MNIITKLQCESVLVTKGQQTIKLRAVSGPGNETWSKWTPSAEFSITITNPECFGVFDPGTSYDCVMSKSKD